jgi:hypothetical protein
MPPVYLSTAYLAPIRYYSKLAHFDEISMEVWENYPRQTWRNRCLIAAANGRQILTVPVEKPATLKCPTRDIRISNHGNWRHSHWNALVSAYNMSPFFEYYADDFRPLYENAYKYLIEYNEVIRGVICDLLDLHPVVTQTEKYIPEVPNDFRTEPDLLRRPNPDASFTPRPYYQVFRDKHGFIPHLSIVDLLFNMGPESILFL